MTDSKKFRVVVVDDEWTRVELIVERMKREGLEAIYARTLAEANSILSNNKADALILDIIMPIDSRIKLSDLDWNGLDESTSYTGVAFHNYLVRNRLIDGLPRLILTNAPKDHIRGYFLGIDDVRFEMSGKNISPYSAVRLLKEMMSK